MRLELTGRHVPITPAVRTIVEKQLAATRRLLNDSVVSVQIVLSKEKLRYRAEVTVHARGENFLHGAGVGRGVATAMGAAMAKIDRQVQTLKGKWDGRKRRTGAAPAPASALPAAATQDVRVIRARRYPVRPLSIDDAAQEMGDGSDTFLVFRNLDTDAIAVLFRRPDGHLGLIEPEA
jgi:putative sigma-54 modulation protein